MDRIRFAVVGVGGFGKKRINAISDSRSAELAYVADLDKKLAGEVGRNTSAEVVTLEELLSKNDFDVANIAVPNIWHSDLAVKFMKAGKDVWCEKPMSTGTESARRMVLKSVETRRILKVGSNVRYFPNVMRASKLIADGLLGRILSFRGWIGNDGSHLANKEWYADRGVSGGGTLLDNGVHLIDLIRHLVDEVRSCNWCQCSNLQWNLNSVEDNAVCSYGLSGGAIGFIQSSWTDRTGYMYFEIHGDAGFVNMDSRWSKSSVTYGKRVEDRRFEDLTDFGKRSYDLELEDFLKCLKSDLHPRPTSYDGYRAVKIVAKSYESESSARQVNTFDALDRKLKQRFRRTFEVELGPGQAN